MNSNIENVVKNYSLSGEEMIKLNPDANLYKYTDLYKFKDIDDAFGDKNKIILLYLLKNQNYGHWTCLMKKKGYYEFFDPYGVYVDQELHEFITPEKRKELNETHDYLLSLLKNNKNKYKIKYNNVTLQGKNSKTCGMHTSYRLINYNLTLQEYVDKLFINKNINDPDFEVGLIIFKKLGYI